MDDHDHGDEDRRDQYPQDQGSVDLYVLAAIASLSVEHQTKLDVKFLLRWWHQDDPNVIPSVS